MLYNISLDFIWIYNWFYLIFLAKYFKPNNVLEIIGLN